MKIRALAGGIVFLVASQAAPKNADAGACPSPRIRTDHAQSKLPTNTQIRFIFQAQEVSLGSGGVRTTAERVQFVLRTEDGKEVASKVRRLPRTVKPIFVLTPKRTLSPSSTFVVFVRVGDKTAKSMPPREIRLHSISTGPVPDTTPPLLGKIGELRFVGRRRVKHWKDTSGPDLAIDLIDFEATRETPLAMEIHELGQGSTADDSTLRAIETIGYGTIWIGETSPCWPSNFQFAKREMRLGLRAIDPAGNRGPLHIVDLKTKH